MKKMMMFAVAAALVLALSGCGSLRTPDSGSRADKVYYNTFFGLSIESALYGDGIVLQAD